MKALQPIWNVDIKYDDQAGDALEILSLAGREASPKTKFLTTYLAMERLIETKPRTDSAQLPEEAARLGSVLPNPRKYNPTGEQRYVVNRSKAIYGIMVKRGIVVPEEYQEVVQDTWSSGDEASGPIPIEKLKPAD